MRKFAFIMDKSVVLMTQEELDHLPLHIRTVLIAVPWLNQPETGPYGIPDPEQRLPESEL